MLNMHLVSGERGIASGTSSRAPAGMASLPARRVMTASSSRPCSAPLALAGECSTSGRAGGHEGQVSSHPGLGRLGRAARRASIAAHAVRGRPRKSAVPEPEEGGDALLLDDEESMPAPAAAKKKGASRKKAVPEYEDEGNDLGDFFAASEAQPAKGRKRAGANEDEEAASVGTRAGGVRKYANDISSQLARLHGGEDAYDNDAADADADGEGEGSASTAAAAAAAADAAQRALERFHSVRGLKEEEEEEEEEDAHDGPMEDTRPKLFGMEVTDEMYRKWWVERGDEFTAEWRSWDWPRPKTQAQRNEVEWTMDFQEQFVRDWNYEDFDNAGFASHHEQREKCVNIYANTKHIANIMKQIEDVDYKMGEKATYFNSWARAEVLFRPSIDAYNDYLRENIESMSRNDDDIDEMVDAEEIERVIITDDIMAHDTLRGYHEEEEQEQAQRMITDDSEMAQHMLTNYLFPTLPGVVFSPDDHDLTAATLADDIFSGEEEEYDVDKDDDGGDGDDADAEK